MGAGRAADPAGQARRRQADGRSARGGQRALHRRCALPKRPARSPGTGSGATAGPGSRSAAGLPCVIRPAAARPRQGRDRPCRAASPTAPIKGRSFMAHWLASSPSSRPRSSSDPIAPRASSCCPSAGLLNAPSPGSIAVGPDVKSPDGLLGDSAVAAAPPRRARSVGATAGPGFGRVNGKATGPAGGVAR